jgi:hypothetical protein
VDIINKIAGLRHKHGILRPTNLPLARGRLLKESWHGGVRWILLMFRNLLSAIAWWNS